MSLWDFSAEAILGALDTDLFNYWGLKASKIWSVVCASLNE